jgi:ferredoxin-NADP reductase
VRLGVPIDGQRHTRTYSISSAPNRDDGCITVTVKAVPGGRVSQHLVQQVQVGEYLPLGEPQGEFVLPESMPVRPLFITAGSGITPIMSMLRNYVQELEVIPDSVHLHYAPHPREVIFGSELAALAASQPHYKLQHIYTREGGAHFNAAQLEAVCPDWRAREVWACGPASLLEAVEAHWHAAGLDHQLHVERFHAPIAISTEAATAGRVRFAASATEAASDGVSNLLRIAEDAGLNPKHGCRMGICHGCDTKLVSGSVTCVTAASSPNRATPCKCASAPPWATSNWRCNQSSRIPCLFHLTLLPPTSTPLVRRSKRSAMKSWPTAASAMRAISAAC